MSTIQERIREVIATEAGNKSVDFAAKLGKSPKQVSNWLQKNSSIGLEVVNIILEAYPYIDANWLLRGKGSKLIKERADSVEEAHLSYTKEAPPPDKEAILELLCYIRERDKIRDQEIKDKDARIEQLIKEKAELEIRLSIAKKGGASGSVRCAAVNE